MRHLRSFTPSGAIEVAIRNGFGDVRARDLVDPVEIGEGERHFEHAFVGARRESEAVEGLFESGVRRLVEVHEGFDMAGGHLCIAVHAGTVGKSCGL